MSITKRLQCNYPNTNRVRSVRNRPLIVYLIYYSQHHHTYYIFDDGDYVHLYFNWLL